MVEVKVARATLDEGPLYKEWLADKSALPWLDSTFREREMTDLLIKMMLSKSDQVFLTIYYDGEPAGLVALYNLDQLNKSADVWTLIDRDYRGLHVGTRAINCLLAYAFEEMELMSLGCWIAASNIASQKMVLSNGFKERGVRRKCHLLNGVLEDRKEYDILREEFLKTKDDHNA